eukprot:700344-Pleurochrysis_carterae.AAC.1
MSWEGPPPCVASESMQSTETPPARINSASPPGRRTGPEKRRRTRRAEMSAGKGAVTAGKPGGCAPSSMPELATGGASRCDGEASECPTGRHGKSVSSKYTSDVVTTLREAGIHTL